MGVGGRSPLEPGTHVADDIPMSACDEAVYFSLPDPTSPEDPSASWQAADHVVDEGPSARCTREAFAENDEIILSLPYPTELSVPLTEDDEVILSMHDPTEPTACEFGSPWRLQRMTEQPPCLALSSRTRTRCTNAAARDHDPFLPSHADREACILALIMHEQSQLAKSHPPVKSKSAGWPTPLRPE